MDGYVFDKKFNGIEEHIDERFKDPNFKVKFGGNEVTIGELNNLIPSTEKKVRFLVEWENMCQYFAFGLVSKLNQITEQDRHIDMKTFVRRKEFPNAIDYVKYKVFPDCKPELIDKVCTKFYKEIMEMSPITEFFAKMNMLRFMLDSVVFVFRYDVPFLDDFVLEIQENKFGNKVRCIKQVLPNEEAVKSYLKSASTFDMYIVADMGLVYQILMKYNKHNASIMSYRNHNGVSDPVMAYYVNEFMDAEVPGPNNIILSFLNEFIPTEEDVKEWTDESKYSQLRQMGQRQST